MFGNKQTYVQSMSPMSNARKDSRIFPIRAKFTMQWKNTLNVRSLLV